MSSNLKVKPIEYGGEGYETQERDGEFFIPGTHAPVTLDSSKEVFNYVAMLVESLRVVVSDTTRSSSSMTSARRRTTA